MDESTFNAYAEAELRRIENLLENSGVDLDIEPKPDGVLEIEFANASRIIINRHSAAREIWIAAKSGGFHFCPTAEGDWMSARERAGLYEILSRLVSEQSGTEVCFAPH